MEAAAGGAAEGGEDLAEELAWLRNRHQSEVARLHEKIARERGDKEKFRALLDSDRARADRVEAENAALRKDLNAVSAQLAASSILTHQRVIESALDEAKGLEDAGAVTEAMLAAIRNSSPAGGGSDDAAGMFRLARTLQMQGALQVAAAAYRKVGPGLPDLLASLGPDGSRVSGPDFLVIGAPRAGTTWLKKALSHHPAVCILSREHHYFSLSNWLSPDLYVQRFAAADALFLRREQKKRAYGRPENVVYGEKSPSYLAMPEAQVDLCAALYPNARIICLVRDPVERAWSHVKHIGLGRHADRISALEDQPFWSSLSELIRIGRYQEHLTRWAKRFAPEQILVIDFARLSTDPEAVYAEVLRHLGLKPKPGVELSARTGEGRQGSPMPDVLRAHLEAAYAHDSWDVATLRKTIEEVAAGAAGGTSLPRQGGALAAG